MKFNWIGMSSDGNRVVLERFSGHFRTPDYATDEWINDNAKNIRRGLIIDLETTGFNKGSDKIIELAARSFLFDRGSGAIVKILDAYSDLEDPQMPIPKEVSRVTGITNEMVVGQSIKWEHVESLLSQADLIVAHNASFDRPFLDRYTKTSSEKAWGCSLKQIDWNQKNFPTSKLEVLTLCHGFFIDAHRALSDVDALLHLLSFQDSITRQSYLQELLINARRPMTRVNAVKAPFESKDLLKERGYAWDTQKKLWWKSIRQEDRENEAEWLTSAVYKGTQWADFQDIPLHQNFRT